MPDFKDILFQKEIHNLDIIPFKVADLLLEKKYTIAVAESVSGGEICSQLVKIPGASKFLLGGIVAYNNLFKVNECQVNPKTIIRYSPVSSQTTIEMAKGLVKKFQANVSIATTGFAGPQQDQEKVGLVYIALIINSNEIVKNFLFTGDRKEIISQTTFAALELTRYYLSI